MALKKSIGTPVGFSIEYWKITMIIEDYINNTTRVILSGYVSAEARAAGSSPFTTKDYVIVVRNETENVYTIEDQIVTDEQGNQTTIQVQVSTPINVERTYVNNNLVDNANNIQPIDRSSVYNILKLTAEWNGAEDL